MIKPIRHQTVKPYLVVNGASFLLEFLQKVFDEKLLSMIFTKDKLIRYAEIQIGTGTILLAHARRWYKIMQCNNNSMCG